MKSGGLISWNAVAICEMFKISWKMEEHLVRDGSENHFKPSIPFGAMCEYVQISADQSWLHQFGKTVSPGIFLGCASVGSGIRKEDMLVADIEELGTLNA